jgi:AcrR family transcriptional regulator
MDPTTELRERDVLLDRIQSYAGEHGLGSLTLDDVAAAFRIPLLSLRGYFDTKDELVVALIARSRVRMRDAFARLNRDVSLDPAERRRGMWKFILEHEIDFRFFFEAYGLALHDHQYGAFMHGVGDWIRLMKESTPSQGRSDEQVEALATLVLAVYRGVMMDLCATGDRERVNAAIDLWFELLATLDAPVR